MAATGWPYGIAPACCPLAGFHRRIVWSADAEITHWLLGVNATVDTAAVCPAQLAISLASATFQTFSALSAAPEAACVPFELRATPVTVFACPANLVSSLLSARFQTRAVLSAEPEM